MVGINGIKSEYTGRAGILYITAMLDTKSDVNLFQELIRCIVPAMLSLESSFGMDEKLDYVSEFKYPLKKVFILTYDASGDRTQVKIAYKKP